MRVRFTAMLTSFVVASALTLGLAGCDSPPQTMGGKPREKAIKAVVSLSPSTTELVGSMNYSGVLKGRTAADDYPMAVKSVPIVASVKPDYEKLVELKPDVVIYDADLFNEQDVEKIKSLGFRTYVFDAKTIEGFVKQVQLLGPEIAAETNASKYADKVLEAQRASIADAIPNPPKVAVLLIGNGTEHMVCGTDTFLADVVKTAGGTLVGPSADRFVSLSPETLISADPDLLVVPFEKVDDKEKSRANAEKQLNMLLADSRLSGLKAIKNRRIMLVDEDVLTRRGYRVNNLIEDFHRRFASGK